MPVPHPAEITLPLLKCLANGRDWYRTDWEAEVAQALVVSPRALASRRFGTNCSWAWIHLRYARLVEGKAAGPTRITARGVALLEEQPVRIDASVLNKYEEYRCVEERWKVPVYLRPTDDPKELEKRVKMIFAGHVPTNPPGVEKPRRLTRASTRFERDPSVIAAALRLAGGTCEACSAGAPFLKPGGKAYLEVHHVRTLAEGGPDTIGNAVAVCPNCHRALHFAEDAAARAVALLRNVGRLKPPQVQ